MPRPVIRAAGRGRALEIGPTRATIKLAGAEAGDRLGVVELEFGPGFAGPPRHRHRETDHAWYVLTGQLEVSVNGQQRVLAAGDFAFIPRGTPHGFATHGAQPARLLEVDTPRPLDAYLDELTAAFPAGAAVDQAEVAAIQRRHDPLPAG